MSNLTRTCIQTFKGDLNATYVPKDGNSYQIAGVFDRRSYDVDPASGAPIMSAQPSFGIVLADLTAPVAPGDQLIFNSVTYDIVNSEFDGIGGGKLILAVAD